MGRRSATGSLDGAASIEVRIDFDEADRLAAKPGAPTASTIDRETVDANRASLRLPEAGVDIRELLARIERELLEQAIARASGNKSEAARLLGLQRTTLIEKLRRLRISD